MTKGFLFSAVMILTLNLLAYAFGLGSHSFELSSYPLSTWLSATTISFTLAGALLYIVFTKFLSEEKSEAK